MSSGGNVSRRRMRGITRAGSTAPGDGGDDRDLVAVLERGLLRLEKPDVLLVHVDIDEAPQLARLVHEPVLRSEEHTSELQSHSDLVCRLLLEKKKKNKKQRYKTHN